VRRVWVGVIALCACHSVFDLEPIPDVPMGHDDDTDGIPDVVDLCPGIPASGTDDEDDDHVGDLCDPLPSVANQQPGMFLALDGADLMSWMVTGGSWSPESSAFLQSDLAANMSRIARVMDLGASPWTIELAFEATGIGNLVSTPNITIISDDDNDASTAGYVCGFRYDSGVWKVQFDHPGFDTLTDVGLPLITARRYAIQLTVQNNTVSTCRIHDGERWYDAPTGAGGTKAANVAVEVHWLAARLHSIAIYEAAP
jgi:hypothetical protein